MFIAQTRPVFVQQTHVILASCLHEKATLICVGTRWSSCHKKHDELIARYNEPIVKLHDYTTLQQYIEHCDSVGSKGDKVWL